MKGQPTYWSIIVLLVALGASGCVSRLSSVALQRFAYEQPQMGVPFRIVLYAGSEAEAESAATAAFARIAELNAIMSDYETDSELSELSRSSEQGSPEVRVSDALWTVLERSQQLAYETDGAFDITIGPCVALWRKARREQEFPDAARLETARGKVGYRNLVLHRKNKSAKLSKFGMRLDLGAIAKGYAADEAVRVLRGRGIARALVAASGDLALGDAPPGEVGWRVELTGAGGVVSAPTNYVQLANCGVATSGDLIQRVELNGIRYSHIVDPFTCIGMTNNALATVVATDCMTADSLATAMTIVEQKLGEELARKYKAAVRVVRFEGGKPAVWSNRSFRRLISRE